jgi:hypothetical protein
MNRDCTAELSDALSSSVELLAQVRARRNDKTFMERLNRRLEEDAEVLKRLDGSDGNTSKPFDTRDG